MTLDQVEKGKPFTFVGGAGNHFIRGWIDQYRGANDRLHYVGHFVRDFEFSIVVNLTDGEIALAYNKETVELVGGQQA